MLSLFENLIECAPASPLQTSFCGEVNYFENRAPGAEIIALLDSATGKFTEELDAPAEDALVLSCFDKR